MQPSLGNTQRDFTLAIAKLIQWAYDNGYELTFGDAYRDPRVHALFGVKQAYGAQWSVHKLRLAVDLNLFVRGEYVTNSEAYKPLGDYWKTLSPLARWGGDFKAPDGNHFSFTYQGRA